jgi:hypothetical protein
MSEFGSHGKLRKLMEENRVLRAQVKMACMEVERLAMQQEVLLDEAAELAAWREVRVAELSRVLSVRVLPEGKAGSQR